MPLKRCTKNGKPGWSYGNAKCYTYTPGDKASEKAAKKKAIRQGLAIDKPAGFKKEMQKSKAVIWIFHEDNNQP